MAMPNRKAATRPLAVAQPVPFTKPLSILLVATAALTIGVYLHTVNVEGTSNRHQLDIKQMRNTNLHLQLELATVQAPHYLETQAKDMSMGPASEVVYLPAFSPPAPVLRSGETQEALAPLVGY